MRKLVSAIALGAALSGCAGPVITDISTDKVKVVSEFDNLEGATLQAAQGCSLYKRVPVFLSKFTGSGYHYLFACMAPDHANVKVQ